MKIIPIVAMTLVLRWKKPTDAATTKVLSFQIFSDLLISVRNDTSRKILPILVMSRLSNGGGTTKVPDSCIQLVCHKGGGSQKTLSQ